MLSVKANLLSGDISKSDLANIYKFDNKLYTIKTTGKQIKTYLEWTANIYNTFKEGDLTVSFNPKFESFKYDMLQGVSYKLNISKPVGQRVENLCFTDGNEVKDTDEVYLTVNDYRYNSNLALIFDQGEYEKVYESTNDALSDIRDMIAEYIEDVKGGVITRNVDNNWSLTGITYNEPLRAEVVKLINEGVLTQEVNYSLVSKALTATDCINQLEAKGKVQEVEKIKSVVHNKIDVISFNDFHGSVIESGTNVGAAKLAGYINSHKNNISDVYNFIPVSGGDMYELMPFDNTLVTMDLKGCDIVKAIEHGIAPQGFGWGQFSGVKVWYDEETNKITSIRFADGTPLDMNKYYKVVVNDYMSTGGSNYDFIAGKNINETNIVMRDAISKYWKENGMPSVEDDLLIAGEDTTIKNPSIDIPSEDNSSKDKLEENNNSNNTLENKVENLVSELEDKKTGDDINIEVFAFVSLMAIAVTIMFFSNKKRKTI